MPQCSVCFSNGITWWAWAFWGSFCKSFLKNLPRWQAGRTQRNLFSRSDSSTVSTFIKSRLCFTAAIRARHYINAKVDIDISIVHKQTLKSNVSPNIQFGSTFIYDYFHIFIYSSWSIHLYILKTIKLPIIPIIELYIYREKIQYHDITELWKLKSSSYCLWYPLVM